MGHERPIGCPTCPTPWTPMGTPPRSSCLLPPSSFVNMLQDPVQTLTPHLETFQNKISPFSNSQFPTPRLQTRPCSSAGNVHIQTLINLLGELKQLEDECMSGNKRSLKENINIVKLRMKGLCKELGLKKRKEKKRNRHDRWSKQMESHHPT